MELYFICPVTKQSFGSRDYFLEEGYLVSTQEKGKKSLQGTVKLKSGCPLCGQDHQFQADDVLCPLRGGKSEK